MMRYPIERGAVGLVLALQVSLVTYDASTGSSMSQATPPGVVVWSSAELARRDAALGEAIGPDGSGRETLADYGLGGTSHGFRFIRRERDGWPEVHADIIDVVFVQSGREPFA